MRNYIALATGKIFGDSSKGHDEYHTWKKGVKSSIVNNRISEESGIVYRTEGGNIAVQGHKCKHPRLHPCESVHKEYLGQVSIAALTLGGILFFCSLIYLAPCNSI